MKRDIQNIGKIFILACLVILAGWYFFILVPRFISSTSNIKVVLGIFSLIMGVFLGIYFLVKGIKKIIPFKEKNQSIGEKNE